MTRLERMTAAIDEYVGDVSASLEMAKAALIALKYSDGWDEDLLIAASSTYRIEAVSLVEAWDAIIEAAIMEAM